MIDYYGFYAVHNIVPLYCKDYNGSIHDKPQWLYTKQTTFCSVQDKLQWLYTEKNTMAVNWTVPLFSTEYGNSIVDILQMFNTVQATRFYDEKTTLAVL
jgi:hypothetical protein